MTEPTENDTAKSAADEALAQQPVANPDAAAEADQDSDTDLAMTATADDERAADAAN